LITKIILNIRVNLMSTNKLIEQFNLKNNVAIVTGAAGGLGQELAKILAEAGATLVLTDVHETALKNVEETLLKNGHDVSSIQCDIRNQAEVTSLIKNVHQSNHRIDILVNCAAILGENATVFNIEGDDWDNVMSTNLKGTWMLSKYVSEYMVRENIKGRIVNISSSLGLRAQMKRIHYATAKAGVEHLTRNMAMELIKYGIRVNCLAPGWVATPMVNAILETPEGKALIGTIPMKRAADPSEMSGALLLLTSEASSYMTGSILRVDGGYSYCGIEPEELNE
jgi:NAD(P)-dependent dehydrogenase (short-subunit alcohol dehydrogenase family)